MSHHQDLPFNDLGGESSETRAGLGKLFHAPRESVPCLQDFVGYEMSMGNRAGDPWGTGLGRADPLLYSAAPRMASAVSPNSFSSLPNSKKEQAVNRSSSGGPLCTCIL